MIGIFKGEDRGRIHILSLINVTQSGIKIWGGVGKISGFIEDRRKDELSIIL